MSAINRRHVVVGLALLAAACTRVSSGAVATPVVSPISSPAPSPPAPGLRTALLPLASIAYPKDWSLIAFDVQDTRLLQLSNFAPGWRTFSCFAGGLRVPPGGVLLLVRSVLPTDQIPAGELSRPSPRLSPASSECWRQRSDLELVSAAWSPSGERSKVAELAYDPGASDADRSALIAAFRSLRTLTPTDPQMEPFLGTPALIVDTRRTPIGPMTVYGSGRRTASIGLVGPAGSGVRESVRTDGTQPYGDERTDFVTGSWGTVVWGEVGIDVAQARVDVGGETIRPTLSDLPAGFPPWHQLLWGIVDQPSARVVTALFDADGHRISAPWSMHGSVTIAVGAEPRYRSWRIFTLPTAAGTALGFVGDRRGVPHLTTACCIELGHRVVRPVGYMDGALLALVPPNVTRVEVRTAHGDAQGNLYPISSDPGSAFKVAVIFPGSSILRAYLVTSDARGRLTSKSVVRIYRPSLYPPFEPLAGFETGSR